MAEPRPVRGADVAIPGPALPERRVLRALGVACGLDLDTFRAPHVARTVGRAVERLGLADADALSSAVARDPALRARFRRAIAVSTTGMFRDPEQFRLLDRLLEHHGPRRRPLRVWSVGSSDGSELFSLAMVLDGRGVLPGATLLGSDLLPENVERARGRSRQQLEPAASAAVRFEQRDVTRSAPAGTWDVVLCRNVTIHLQPDARHAMLDHVAGGLAPGGLLLLGRSERLSRDERRGLLDAGANAYRRAGA